MDLPRGKWGGRQRYVPPWPWSGPALPRSSLVSGKSCRIAPRYAVGGRDRPFIPGPVEAAEQLGSSRPARSGTRTVAGASHGTEPVSCKVWSAGGGRERAAMREPEAVGVGIDVAKM